MRNNRIAVAVSSLLCLAVWLGGASVAFGQTSWRDSLAVLQQQIRHNPADMDLRLRKAAVNIELEQWEYAVEEYGRVLQHEPHNLTAHFFRAYAFVQQRQLPMAAADYEAVLQQLPSHFAARLGLAEVRRKQGRRSDALDQLNMLVQQHPDSATAWAMRATYEEEIALDGLKTDADGNPRATLSRQAVGLLETAEYDWQQAAQLAPGRYDFKRALRRVRRLMRNED
jgi:tetratricopeptide (TPR) repeat protein